MCLLLHIGFPIGLAAPGKNEGDYVLSTESSACEANAFSFVTVHMRMRSANLVPHAALDLSPAAVYVPLLSVQRKTPHLQVVFNNQP